MSTSPRVHDHTHHEHQPADFGRAFKIGVTLNVGFVIVEFIGGFAFNSVSLLSDAGHNLGDVFGLLLAWLGFGLAKNKPTKTFSYGLGSATIIASTINGAILLLAVGAISWEAINRLGTEFQPHGSGIVWIAGVGVIINALTAWLFFKGRSHDLNIKGAYLHMVADTLVSIGVAGAGLVIIFTGWNWVDPVVSLLVAAVILYSTIGLFRDSLVLLSHGVPRNVDLDEVRSYFLALPNVASCHDLHIWALSTTQTALTVHLVTDKQLAGKSLLNRIANELHEKFGIDHATVQVESPSEAGNCDLLDHQ